MNKLDIYESVIEPRRNSLWLNNGKLKYLGPNGWADILGSGGSDINVIDNLTSTSTTNALSANQGRVLKGLIDTKFPTADMPGRLLTDQVSYTFTATDVQLNLSRRVLQTNNKYNTEAFLVTIPSANPTQAGAYPADHYNKVQNLPLNTLAELNNKADLVDGKVPAAQLPSFVDDVVEGTLITSTRFQVNGLDVVPETSKIYIDTTSNICYRWGGSTYASMNESLALGESSSTAYRGDLGKIAYDHVSNTGNPHNVTASQIGLGNVNNTLDINKPVSNLQAAAISNSESINYALRFDNNALNTSILDNSSINILTLLSSTNISLEANTSFANWNLTSGVLKFPVPKLNPYVDYRINVRLTGTIGGSINTSREFSLVLRRGDDTEVARENITKVVNNSISSRSKTFESYTNTNTDPFISSGIKLVIENNSGQTINITGLTVLIKGITK